MSPALKGQAVLSVTGSPGLASAAHHSSKYPEWAVMAVFKDHGPQKQWFQERIFKMIIFFSKLKA